METKAPKAPRQKGGANGFVSVAVKLPLVVATEIERLSGGKRNKAAYLLAVGTDAVKRGVTLKIEETVKVSLGT
jgi:hypothetical protein